MQHQEIFQQIFDLHYIERKDLTMLNSRRLNFKCLMFVSVIWDNENALFNDRIW